MSTITTARPLTLRPMFTADGDLDLRGFHAGRDGFEIHALKATAQAAARRAGLRRSAVQRAATRFCVCWVVGAQVGPSTFRAHGPAGIVDLPFLAPSALLRTEGEEITLEALLAANSHEEPEILAQWRAQLEALAVGQSCALHFTVIERIA